MELHRHPSPHPLELGPEPVGHKWCTACSHWLAPIYAYCPQCGGPLLDAAALQPPTPRKGLDPKR